jgi:Zn-dependent protease with chaperone function
MSSQPEISRSYCRFTAKRGAAAVDGTASLRLTGVEIDLGHAQPRRVWHYGKLRIEEPLRPNAIDVLLTSSEDPGATLFVQGQAFAAGLKAHAPHLSARAGRWRDLRPWLLFAALVAGLVLSSYALGWSPLRTIAMSFPESWRTRLGTAVRESMTEGHKQCVDANGLTALAHLTSRLSKSADVAIPFNVRVYDWSLMNAFAVPGGQIVLTKGLLDKAESPDEVAGVLAHEMGHGIEMHPEVSIIRSIGLGTAVQVMLGGGTGGGLANVGLMLAQLGYSRGAEREADLQALALLKGAGIAPKGLGDFFTRVMKMEANDPSAKSGAFNWLRTHPPAAERALLVRRQADYPATPALDAQSWQELKAICKTTAENEKHNDED